MLCSDKSSYTDTLALVLLHMRHHCAARAARKFPCRSMNAVHAPSASAFSPHSRYTLVCIQTTRHTANTVQATCTNVFHEFLHTNNYTPFSLILSIHIVPSEMVYLPSILGIRDSDALVPVPDKLYLYIHHDHAHASLSYLQSIRLEDGARTYGTQKSGARSSGLRIPD